MVTTALIIFIITYLGIIFTRLPKVNVDRPSAAFFGAVAMVLFGVLTFEEAIKSIDFHTITLLLGMMILITVLELDGFFTLIANKTILYAKTPKQLLLIIVFITGFGSAFLVNDAVVLLFTPVVIKICTSAKLNPIPFLIAEIMASNTGSVMTITGNPQNILIGMQSGISYSSFLFYLFPISIIGMFLIFFVMILIYKNEFNKKINIEYSGIDFNFNYSSMKISVPIFLIVIILFFLSNVLKISIPMIALFGASLILIFGKIKPSKVIKEVDWVLLLFFAGLFIVVQGIEKVGVLNSLTENTPLSVNIEGLIGIHFISLILSQIVSNVPYTILMLPIMKIINSDLMWMALASSATLAGNLTIIGAMANLIVIEIADKYNIKIKFWEFLKTGVIVTILSLIISILILYLQYEFGVIGN